jgi:hypothetical protein
MIGGQKRQARHTKLQILSFRDTGRFKGYRLIDEYDIGHKGEFCVALCHPRDRAEGRELTHRCGPTRSVTRMTAGLLPGRPDDVADPLPGLFIQWPGNPVLPGEPVCLDLLQDHPSQPGEHCGGHHRQQHGSRFLSHPAILVTPPVQLQNPGERAAAQPSKHPLHPLPRPGRIAETRRIQGEALRPVEWTSKLAERPSTRLTSVSPNTPVRRETAPLRCALTQAHAQELPDAPDRC